MSALGIATRIGSRLFGKVFSRILGPLGIALTIGECTYLGLKYSGTLDKFNNLYCNKCRSDFCRRKRSPNYPWILKRVFTLPYDAPNAALLTICINFNKKEIHLFALPLTQYNLMS